MTRRISYSQTLLIGCSLAVSLAGCGFSSTSVLPQHAIQHIVVIFQENVSFDHYFATYPNALNSAGEARFSALQGTPSVDGLSQELLQNNPNATNYRNGFGAANPFRLGPANAATADQNHQYNPEQAAFHNGAMDLFPAYVGSGDSHKLGTGVLATRGLTMGYYDGNTVTAMWNYAQHYAMSDRSFGTTFGPSTVGALNLISGQTNGVVDDAGAAGVMVSDGGGGHTLFGNASPTGDICSTTNGPLIHMTGKNVGDFLNAASVSWGFFSAGFDTTTINPNGSTGCRRSHTSEVTGVRSADYTAFLEPFQFYESTANTKHARPLSAQTIGHADDGNTHHQYDLQDFFDALSANNFPAVSFLKAADYQDGHAGYSDPLDEQTFLVNTINTIEQSPDWTSTVIIIAYDDSDGWYDHVHNVVNGSATPWDAYSSRGVCGDASSALPGVKPGTAHAQGRCGYGPRLPLLVISPWAKPNYVSHTVTDQSSILQWIEDVFLNQQRMGGGSFDVLAGSLGDMFDFTQPSPRNSPLMLLDPSSGTIMSAK